ncbi:outer membrane protein assembly factor BamD [Hymenobacter properus]|uniref:Outer membrane protein assembly factor BamD n=1 Tax=Hymenobacter properus TaxID=2791026 RepID=A0A931BJE3_9BACT|nr:outer membrane protein assembly factor BamD [Hymenobacter properus]MBF9143387.1 outer membrane protein assembly factor BamD [Hymenobacter properus]MBR7722200.1 outer membrane protein assembly factor BamD [Microvirga sp. SRT04]
MPISRLTVLFLLVSTLLLGACASGYQRLLKSTDVNKKYAAAVQYYEKGDFFRAGTLLEDLIPLLKGRPEAEKAQFYFANTNYKQRNYVLSSFYFKQFIDTYPNSEYTEEATFLNAKSLFLDSPGFELDQTNTVSALESIQDFLNRYPDSKFKAETENMAQELQKKLENKAFESARLYYQLRYNQAAVVALTNFQLQYPASAFAEQAAFLRLTAQYSWAKESVEAKQRERYQEAVNFYQQFIDAYPKSKSLKAAQDMYDFSQTEIARLKSVPTAASN